MPAKYTLPIGGIGRLIWLKNDLSGNVVVVVEVDVVDVVVEVEADDVDVVVEVEADDVDVVVEVGADDVDVVVEVEADDVDPLGSILNVIVPKNLFASFV